MAADELSNKITYEARFPDGRLYGQVGPRHLRRMEDTLKRVIPGARSLLDVGCFSGHWLHHVLQHRRIERHLGIDVSDSHIEEARELFPELNVKVAYAEKLDLPEGGFDVVTCLEVLEHIPQWEAVFDSLFGWADRQVVVTVPYKEKIRYTACIHCGQLTPMYGHLRSYDESSFPQRDGWSRSFVRLRDRDPGLHPLRKVFWLLKGYYPWLVVDYRRCGT